MTSCSQAEGTCPTSVPLGRYCRSGMRQMGLRWELIVVSSSELSMQVEVSGYRALRLSLSIPRVHGRGRRV